jgi:uncharacterized protein involved in response to NO
LLRIAAAWAIDAQAGLLEASGLTWVAAFALFAAQYGPMLLASRK